MSFFAILFALLIEQVRPLGRHNWLHASARAWSRWGARNLDAGKPQHGWIAWGVVALVPALGVLAVHWMLVAWVGFPFAVLWNVAVLYATLGFRQFSHHFTAIRDALEAGDEPLARQLLAQWRQIDAAQLPRSEIVRHVVEHSVLAAHRHVFGVLLWYSLLSAFGLGPAGAVFYRLSEFVSRYWGHVSPRHPQPASAALQHAAARAWAVVDWLPARTTALAFAVVGSFEEAIDCWRNHAQRFPGDNDGIVLAATSGALGVRLGTMPEPMPGREPESAHLRSVVGLVWRTVVLWMVLLALLTMARLIG